MSFPRDIYPYTNFHELNLGYFIIHFREIFSQWADLYDQMTDWKDATDEELTTWKAGVEADLDQREAALRAELETWKAQTGQDIAGWEDATLAALTAWQTATQAVFEAIRVEAAGSASAAAASAGDAATAKTAAETAQAAAEAAAASIASSAAQIATNTADISDLKTQLSEIAETVTPINKYNPDGTGGYNTAGTYLDYNFMHWQEFPAVEGDVLRVYNWNGTAYDPYSFRWVTPYKNNVASSGGGENLSSYTVPSGKDTIRVTINTSVATNPLITINTTDVPETEQEYFEDVYAVKTDKTLSDNFLPANAKATGERLNELGGGIEENTDDITTLNNNFSSIAETATAINRFNPDGTGYYNMGGVYNEANSYRWQDFTAVEGNVLRIYNWNGTEYETASFRFITPYKDNTAKAGGAENLSEYTIPANMDFIRMSINLASYTKPLITINTTDIPTNEEEYFADKYIVKTDKTLSDNYLPANAQATGNAIRNNEEKPVQSALPNMSMFANFAACGDSFTVGSIFNGGGTLIGDFPNSSWASALARMANADVSIYASGGSNTKLFQTRETDLPALLADTAKELYILCLGINDTSAVTLGTVADLNEDYTQNPDTYYGNYGRIISQIKAHAPNAKIIISKVFIPTYYNSEFYDYSSAAIEEIADYYNIPYVDTAEIPFMCSDLYNTEIRTHGSHPTAPIYSAIAKGMKVLIDDCIAKNLSYFDDFYIPSI